MGFFQGLSRATTMRLCQVPFFFLAAWHQETTLLSFLDIEAVC